MKKLIIFFIALLMFCSVIMPLSAAEADAASVVEHTVIKGESLWRISVKYQVGFYDILNANPQFKNPDLIYPGNTVYVPLVDSSVKSYEQQVIDLVNKERSKNGLKALTANWELSRIARIKSQDMHDNNYFSHTSPKYGTPFDMIKAFGLSYRTAGENIAKGQKTPAEVVNGWMNSAGHRANILNSSYTQIGVGYVSSGNYWTQMFIG